MKRVCLSSTCIKNKVGADICRMAAVSSRESIQEKRDSPLVADLEILPCCFLTRATRSHPSKQTPHHRPPTTTPSLPPSTTYLLHHDATVRGSSSKEPLENLLDPNEIHLYHSHRSCGTRFYKEFISKYSAEVRPFWVESILEQEISAARYTVQHDYHLTDVGAESRMSDSELGPWNYQ